MGHFRKKRLVLSIEFVEIFAEEAEAVDIGNLAVRNHVMQVPIHLAVRNHVMQVPIHNFVIQVPIRRIIKHVHSHNLIQIRHVLDVVVVIISQISAPSKTNSVSSVNVLVTHSHSVDQVVADLVIHKQFVT